MVTTPDTSFSAAIDPASGPEAGGTLLRITTPGAFPAESVSCSFAGVAVPGTVAVAGLSQPRTAAELLSALVVSCSTPPLPSASQVMATVRRALPNSVDLPHRGLSSVAVASLPRGHICA